MPLGLSDSPRNIRPERSSTDDGQGPEATSTSDGFQPRVLFVSTSNGNGGADRHAVELAVGLQSRGAKMLFACRAEEFSDELCQSSRIATTPFNLSNGSDIPAIRRLVRIIDEHSAEIVHCHSRRDFLTAAVAVMIARAKSNRGDRRMPRLVFHMHLIRTIGAPPWLSGKFFQANVDAIIAVSETVATFLEKAHGLRDETVRTIYNGVETDRYAPAGSPEARLWRSQIRSEWGIPDDALVIGMIGRLGQKGQANLLAVAERLVRRFPKLYFVFVGPERDPGDRNRLLHWTDRQNVAGRIVVPGVSDRIPVVMAGLDVLAHLPVDEAFGLVLVEAMASAVPVVASAIGGCLEVVTDGEAGFLVPARDQEALVRALSPLLDGTSGSELRWRIGENGRATAKRFSRETQLDNLMALYAELCGGKTVSAA